jgi:hypothetical protein
MMWSFGTLIAHEEPWLVICEKLKNSSATQSNQIRFHSLLWIAPKQHCLLVVTLIRFRSVS